MIGKGKKTVSLALKEKLLADIAYYERRIEETLHKTKHNSFDDVESSDDEGNPYTLNAGPSGYELKQQEASLSNCASMTLELAMLTIMQSEVNIMVTPPEVRRHVLEEGTWLEVAAECKIDLVSFTITFYAHKPRRNFAPTRFRSLLVTLTKPAHCKELEGSVLAKQRRPNLALQVLQSYASAFRSRRSTLLELAEKYAEKLRMEAMPEGGYRVKFLDLLTVEWTLDNMWSPIVPFCHRMKFEVEYMPKDYIHTIGRLYKQFKDPSLETSERTEVLAQIFDTCLEAQGPARDLQESFESDPETAGRLHERRTTIDQEPEIPPSHQVSPKKQPRGKENKAQDRKTNMAPPKTIPKKAKKVANVTKKRPNDEVSSDHMDVSKKSKPNDTDVGRSSNDVSNNKTNDKNNMEDGRKGVKRATDSDANSNAKKVRTDDKDGNTKSKSGGKSSKNVMDSNSNSSSMPHVNPKNYVEKPSSSKVKSKKVGEKNGNDNTKKSKSKGTDETDGGKNNDGKIDDNAYSDIPNKDNVIHEEVSDTRSITVKSGDMKKNKKVNTKDDANSKNKGTENSTTTGMKKKVSKATVNSKDPKTIVDISNNKAEETYHADKVASTKAVRESDSSKNLNTKAVAKNIDKDADTKSKNKKENLVSKNTKNVNEGVSNVNDKNIKNKKNEAQDNSKNINTNIVEDTIKEKDKEKVSSKTASKTKKAENISKVSEVADKVKDTGKKEVQSKNSATEAVVKPPVSKKSDQEKVPEKDNNQKSKQKVDRLAEYKNESAKVQSKPPSKEKVKESLDGAPKKKSKINKDQNAHGNNKVLEEKSSYAKKIEDNVQSKPPSKEKVKESLDGAPKKKSKINKDQNAHGNNKVLEEKSSYAKKIEDNVQSKPPSKEKVKESLDGEVNRKSKINKDQKALGNNKVLEEKSSNAKKLEDNLRKNYKENGISKTNTKRNINLTDDKNKKSAVGNIVEKNTNTKVSVPDNNKTMINKDLMQKKINLNETFDVAKTKTNLIKASSNHSNAKAVVKLSNANSKAHQKKPVNIISQTVNRFKKQLENQVEIAEKLKTKIPMMKSIKNIKMSVADKLGGRNLGITKAVEVKTKIPMKSLPVFKKVVKSLPTRISPRKLPSTFKPSTQGFSNK